MDLFCSFPTAMLLTGVGRAEGSMLGRIMELLCLGHMTFEIPLKYLYHSEFNQRSRTARI